MSFLNFLYLSWRRLRMSSFWCSDRKSSQWFDSILNTSFDSVSSILMLAAVLLSSSLSFSTVQLETLSFSSLLLRSLIQKKKKKIENRVEIFYSRKKALKRTFFFFGDFAMTERWRKLDWSWEKHELFIILRSTKSYYVLSLLW